MLTYFALFCSVLRSELRARQDLVAENLALRQQLAVLTRPKRRPRLTATDRLFWSCFSSLWSPCRSTLVLVQPDTVIRWQRFAWRRHWTWKSRRGRLRILQEVHDFRAADTDHSQALATFGRGDVFGEMAPYPGGAFSRHIVRLPSASRMSSPRRYTARARGDSSRIALERTSLRCVSRKWRR